MKKLYDMYGLKSLKKMNKKGIGLTDIPNVALTLVLIALFFAIGMVILTSLQNNASFGNVSAANTAITNSITALGVIPNNWLSLIALIIAAVIVIGLLIGGLMGEASGRGGRL